MRMRRAFLSGFSTIALACGAAQSVRATEAPVGEAPPQIFQDAKAMLGQEVAVKGVLRWTFENRNLFPLGTDPDEPSEAYCLPVLIKRTDSALQKVAESLDRSVVVVRGRIIDPVPPGQVSLGSCKPVGIEVESIEPTKK